MGKIFLLDCTLRDGGYINDWNFGEETIRGFSKKIAQTGIEFFEVGFIKGDVCDPNKTLFPDTKSFSNVIYPKKKGLQYVGMIDMSAPVPLDRITPNDGSSIDGIRVIFKKDKIEEAYTYCQCIQKLGYFISVNIVGTDLYTDKEFIDVIEKFNHLHPFTVAIVDSFGLIKRKQFLRLVYIADHNLDDGIALSYHAHNNLQQAYGNAEALVELNLQRDVIIDACVFGMGRGAGNLNLELFAEFMNENYGTSYNIEPMLEIIDEYLNDIYKTKFWGYSLPFYLSASTGCHPNYAIYLAEKNTLSVKSFNELLRGIPQEDKAKFSKERAETFYRQYQENYVDDRDSLRRLTLGLTGKSVLFLAPGRSLKEYEKEIGEVRNRSGVVAIAVNVCADAFVPDYIFCSNIRRYSQIQGKTQARIITTSNLKNVTQTDYVVNFSSFTSPIAEIIDNSGLMCLRLLLAVGVKEVLLAGMDGYTAFQGNDYFDQQLTHKFTQQAQTINALISDQLKKIRSQITLKFITPTRYSVE